MSFHGHDSFADNVALAPAADSDDDTGGAVDVDSGGERAHGDGVPSSETARKRPTAALAAAGKEAIIERAAKALEERNDARHLPGVPSAKTPNKRYPTMLPVKKRPQQRENDDLHVQRVPVR